MKKKMQILDAIWVSEILLKLIQNPFKNCEAGGSFLQSMEGFEKQVLQCCLRKEGKG